MCGAKRDYVSAGEVCLNSKISPKWKLYTNDTPLAHESPKEPQTKLSRLSIDWPSSIGAPSAIGTRAKTKYLVSSDMPGKWFWSWLPESDGADEMIRLYTADRLIYVDYM